MKNTRNSRTNGRNACCNTTSTVYIAKFTNGLWNDATCSNFTNSTDEERTTRKKNRNHYAFDFMRRTRSLPHSRAWRRSERDGTFVNASIAFRIKRLMRVMYHLNAANRIPNIIFHSMFIDVMCCANVCPVPHKSLMMDSFFHVFGQRLLPFVHSAINPNETTKVCLCTKEFKGTMLMTHTHTQTHTRSGMPQKSICSIKAINTHRANDSKQK